MKTCKVVNIISAFKIDSKENVIYQCILCVISETSLECMLFEVNKKLYISKITISRDG